ncbi:MAG: ubiquinol-cytochrome C chaperone family protein [Candidatus Symbiobacter sp.]|nr:ubiquinol-cytochrome C chaperone family protein [Candidatus Symbiobacter sp.]
MSRLREKLHRLYMSLRRIAPPEKAAAKLLWGQLVAAARAPVFYRDYGVPDRPEARFEMVVIHLYLLLARLKSETNADKADKIVAKRLADALFALMVKDFEQNLRQMGVGDLRVSGKMKKLMAAFYGRIKGFDQCFDDPILPAAQALTHMLRRNLAGSDQPNRGEATDGMAAVADYMVAARGVLTALDFGAIFTKGVAWPIP